MVGAVPPPRCTATNTGDHARTSNDSLGSGRKVVSYLAEVEGRHCGRATHDSSRSHFLHGVGPDAATLN
jgi:hypothetical protein